MGMWMKCPRHLAHIEVTYFLHIIWIQLHVFFCRILLFLHFFCIFDQKESFWQTFAPFFLDLSCNSILFANYCISFANWCIDLAYSGSIFSSIHCAYNMHTYAHLVYGGCMFCIMQIWNWCNFSAIFLHKYDFIMTLMHLLSYVYNMPWIWYWCIFGIYLHIAYFCTWLHVLVHGLHMIAYFCISIPLAWILAVLVSRQQTLCHESMVTIYC